jgi:hypothetical protein
VSQYKRTKAGSGNAACIVAVFGSPGSGKTQTLKQLIKRLRPPRLLVWSPLEDTDHYSELGELCRSLPALVGVLEPDAPKRFAVVYQPIGALESWRAQFDSFCEIALAAGDVMVTCEELADAAPVHSAPPYWSQMLRQGRHRGLRIYASSQRPAQIDKGLFSFATVIRTGRLNYKADVDTLAGALMLPPADIVGLKPLEYLERDMQTGATKRGLVKILP